jgi:hypothetical protein
VVTGPLLRRVFKAPVRVRRAGGKFELRLK